MQLRTALPSFVLAVVGAVNHVQAQTWVPLSPSGAQSPGMPALITVDESQSTEVFTTVSINLFGFWREDVTGPDGLVYQHLTFPGLERINQVGAPDLPAARLNLAGGAGLQEFKFHGTSATSQVFYEGIRPLPVYEPGEDEKFDPTWDPGPGDTTGSDPVWVLDTSIYGGTSPWPTEVAPPAPQADALLGPIRGATVAVKPVSWHAATQVLTVTKSMSLTYQAVGSGEPLTLTKVAGEAATAHFLNWGQSQNYYPLEPLVYHSRYLIVAPSMWWDTLQGFVTHKKLQGYQVSMIGVPSGVDAIRDAIASWYQLGDPGMDHYALLVGDTDWVPTVLTFESGVAVRGDDPYGCVGPLDQSKEVHVGRISVDHEDSLGWQLDKLMEYELGLTPGDYGRVGLVAHEEGAPGKYTGSHTKVRDASYSVAPTFVSLFGADGADNQDVVDTFNGGLGVLAYRGHGSTTTWSDWNAAEEDLHKNDIGPKMVSPMNPVVWAITCTNANIDFDGASGQDSISEVWMEASEGAVASYGATRTTSTKPNHHLNERLFEIVFDQGVTTHAKAIELAEASVWANWPDHKNPWAYLLLGDPSMTIRRGPVFDLVITNAPSAIALDNQGDGALQLQVVTEGGAIDDGLVSVYKAPFLDGQPDEVLGAYWLGDGQQVNVPVVCSTPGTLHLSVRDGDGNMSTQAVAVTMGAAWKNLGLGMQGAYGDPQLVGVGSLEGGQPWSLLLKDARPGAPAFLCLSSQLAGIEIFGGLLFPDVFSSGLIVAQQTDEFGNVTWGGDWPDGIPGGAEFYFQYWIYDESGPQGLVASNGLRATAPQ